MKIGLFERSGALVHTDQAMSAGNTGRQDAADWIKSFSRLVARLPAGSRRAISAVCVSGNGPTLVPIDKRGDPVAPPLAWYEDEKETVLPFSSASYFLKKVLWFSQNRQTLYEKTDCFLPAAEFLVAFLCGNRCAMLAHEGYRPYYWTDEEITSLELDHKKFPPLVFLGVQAGEMTDRAAAATGIGKSTPVYCGGTDYLMALLGTGAIIPGVTNDRGGTYQALNFCSDQALASSSLRTVPGFEKNTWNISGFVPNAGRLYSWLKDKLIGSQASFMDFADLIDQVIPGSSSVRFMPPLSNELVWSELSFKELYAGETSLTTKGEYARAFVEYVGFAVREVVDDIEHCGVFIDSLRASGGLSRSAPLTQIKAAVTGKSVCVGEVYDAELLGNAIVVLCALGEYGGFQEAVRELVRFREEHRPLPALQALYNDLYQEYKQTLKKGSHL